MRIPHRQEVHLLLPATNHFSIRGSTRHLKVKVTVTDLSWSGVRVANKAAGVEVNRFAEVRPGKCGKLVFKFGEHEVVIPGRVAWHNDGVAGVQLNLAIADAASRQAFRRWVAGTVQNIAAGKRPDSGRNPVARQLEEIFEPIEWLHMASLTTPDLQGLSQISAHLKAALERLPKDSVLRDLDAVVRVLEEVMSGSTQDIRDGVARAMEALHTCLGTLGATLLAPVPGDPVDPNLHVVVGAGSGHGTVAATARPGLRVGVRVLRPAQVRVAA
jgi:hypothetical protein